MKGASLLKQILTVDPTKRLSLSDILAHEFFLFDGSNDEEFNGRLSMQIDQLLNNSKAILIAGNIIDEQTDGDLIGKH